jgi:hypothetical protein
MKHMKRKGIAGLIPIVVIATIVMFSGCVEEETPAPTATPGIGVPVAGGHWQVTITDAYTEKRLTFPVGTTYTSKSGYIFLVVEATFRNLDPTQQTNISSEAVAIISEDGKIFVSDGGGSSRGALCVECTFTSSSTGDDVEACFVFVLKEDDIDQVFKLQFQEVPPIPFSVGV